MSQRGVVVVVLSFGLLLAGLVARRGDVALLALPLLAYLAVGILRAPSSREVSLLAERAVTRDVEPGGEDKGRIRAEVRLTIRNAGGPALLLRMVEPLQSGLELRDSGELKQDEGGLWGWLALDKGEERQLRYAVVATRGRYRWQSVRVTAQDPFGLFATELVLPAPAELEVQPQSGKFRRLALPPGDTLHSPGSLPARLAGSGTDFWGVREYHAGDPLRHIDWRLAARHPGQFFTREFEQEEVADVGIIIDARRKTDVRLADDSLFEHTLRAAGSLAETLLGQGHRVSLLVLGAELAAVFPGYSRMQLQRIRHCLARVGLTDSRVTLGYLPLGIFSTRALIVVFSSLASGDRVLFSRLRMRGNRAVLVCPDTVTFAGASAAAPAKPGAASELAARFALRASRAERRLELRQIAAERVCVVDWPVDQPLAPLLQDALRAGRGDYAERGTAT